MQPWNFHQELLFHKALKGPSDLDISTQYDAFRTNVLLNKERASFTAATNAPWTVRVEPN